MVENPEVVALIFYFAGMAVGFFVGWVVFGGDC